MLGSARRRLNEFLLPRRTREIFSEAKNVIDWRRVMDAGEVVLVNLNYDAGNVSALSNIVTVKTRLAAPSNLTGSKFKNKQVKLTCARNSASIGGLDADAVLIEPAPEQLKGTVGDGVLARLLARLQEEVRSTDPAVKRIADHALNVAGRAGVAGP